MTGAAETGAQYRGLWRGFGAQKTADGTGVEAVPAQLGAGGGQQHRDVAAVALAPLDPVIHAGFVELDRSGKRREQLVTEFFAEVAVRALEQQQPWLVGSQR